MVFRVGGDLPVGRLGFGAMRLETEPGAGRQRSLALARRVVEAGVTLIDTAHLYGAGANEELLAEALYPYPDELLVTTKVGVARTGRGGEWRLDGRPEVLREQVELGLSRLRVERHELLQLHRIDPEIPLDEQLGALDELREEGKIARIGLSEVTVEELRRARELLDIASVQNRYNVLDRGWEPVLRACTEAGIAFLPWRPVAGGGDFGAAAAAVEINAVAGELGATPSQVALAWLLGRSPVVCPIPGTASPEHFEENLAAKGLRLTEQQRARLDRLGEASAVSGKDAAVSSEGGA